MRSVGDHPRPLKERGTAKVWHQNDDGTWWTGFMPEGLTTKELFDMCRSIEVDLLRAFPEDLK